MVVVVVVVWWVGEEAAARNLNLPPRKRKTREFHHDLRRCPSERRPSGYRCVFQVRVSTVRAFCPRHVRGNSDEAKLPEFTYTPARAHPACPVCRFGYCVMHTCDMPEGGGAGRAIAPFDEDSMIPPRREEASRARLTKLSVVRSSGPRLEPAPSSRRGTSSSRPMPRRPPRRSWPT